MTALAKLIDQRLTEKGWNRKQLADALGIVAVSVSRWLRPQGDYHVSYRHYRPLATILGIPLTQILKAADHDAPHYVRLYHQIADPARSHGASARRP